MIDFSSPISKARWEQARSNNNSNKSTNVRVLIIQNIFIAFVFKYTYPRIVASNTHTPLISYKNTCIYKPKENASPSPTDQSSDVNERKAQTASVCDRCSLLCLQSASLRRDTLSAESNNVSFINAKEEISTATTWLELPFCRRLIDRLRLKHSPNKLPILDSSSLSEAWSLTFPTVCFQSLRDPRAENRFWTLPRTSQWHLPRSSEVGAGPRSRCVYVM